MELKKAGLIAEFTNNAISGKFGVRMTKGGYWRRVDDDSELLEMARGNAGLFQRLRNDYFTVTVHYILDTFHLCNPFCPEISCYLGPAFKSISAQDYHASLIRHFAHFFMFTLAQSEE